jgi:hypothetical protein
MTSFGPAAQASKKKNEKVSELLRGQRLEGDPTIAKCKKLRKHDTYVQIQRLQKFIGEAG